MSKVILYFLFASWLIYAHSIKAQSSSIDEFNKSFPPSVEVETALKRVDTIIPVDDNYLELFKKRYALKLEFRVFSCVKFLSREESASKDMALTIKRDSCLKEQDEQLLQFIGMSLVSFRSMQAPLRPMVKLGSPSFISNPEGMQVVTGAVASESGVAVFGYKRGEYISYEIPSGNQLAHLPVMPNASNQTAVLSPNGRMIAIRNEGLLSFIDNETGQELWGARNVGDFYAWLPEMQAALVSRAVNGDSKLWLLDFNAVEFSPYSIPYKGQSWALQISQLPSRYLIGSYADFSQIENIRTPTGIISKVIKDYKLAKSSVKSERPILMQNGNAIFFRSQLDQDNDFFTLFDLKTNKEKLFDTGFLSKNQFAKLSENELLVLSYDKGHGAMFPKPWAFNIKNLTLSPIKVDEFGGILSRLGEREGFMLRHEGMWIGDQLKVGEPSQYASIINDYLIEKELSVLESEAYYDKKNIGNLERYEPELIKKRSQLIGNIPSDTKVEFIDWHDGRDADHVSKFPAIDITIEHTNKPIVLILRSYNSVRWNLIKKPGAKLVAVIVYSYDGSIVSGASNTKVIIRTGVNAYRSKYIDIYNDVIALTGKHFSKVQRTYGGNSFSVGEE